MAEAKANPLMRRALEEEIIKTGALYEELAAGAGVTPTAIRRYLVGEKTAVENLDKIGLFLQQVEGPGLIYLTTGPVDGARNHARAAARKRKASLDVQLALLDATRRSVGPGVDGPLEFYETAAVPVVHRAWCPEED